MKMPERFDVVLDMPFGRFGLSLVEETISRMEFVAPDMPLAPPQTAFGQEVAQRLRAWLAAPQQPLELPVQICGTPFQRSVWNVISSIPCGQVLTYRAVADRLGNVARAVGQACGANRFPLLIPCHRVVAMTGLGGFAHATDGYRLEAKRWLLHNEGVL